MLADEIHDAQFGNYGETNDEFNLHVILESRTKSKEKFKYRVELWRLGYS